MVQTVLVALIVGACSLYALWTLMPAAWRRRLGARLGLTPAASGGACGGCGGCPPAAPKAAQPVRVMRRPTSGRP